MAASSVHASRLAQHRELEYAARQLPTIEINGSFYSLQRPASYAAWYAAYDARRLIEAVAESSSDASSGA